MGQRLVITCQARNKDFCNIYYHWSAYSMSALEEAKTLIETWQSVENSGNDKDYLARLIEAFTQALSINGGGIAEKELEYAANQYGANNINHWAVCTNRNGGIICVSEESMDDSQNWSEGNIRLDFDNQIVNNDVLFFWESLEEYNGDYEEDLEPKDILTIEENITVFPFNRIDAVEEAIRFVEHANYGLAYMDGELIQVIC